MGYPTGGKNGFLIFLTGGTLPTVGRPYRNSEHVGMTPTAVSVTDIFRHFYPISGIVGILTVGKIGKKFLLGTHLAVFLKCIYVKGKNSAH